MAGQQPPADGGANGLMNMNVNGPGPSAPPVSVPPAGGGYDRVLNQVVNPQSQAVPDMPSTEGKTDQQVAQDLSAYDFDARLAQGKLTGGQVTYGGAPAGGGGGGYKLDPQTLDRAMKELQQMRQDTMEDFRDIYQVENCQAPAPDVDSSEMQAAAVRKLGDNLRAENQTYINFLNQRIQELQDAKQQYMTQEQVTEEQWQRLAKGIKA